MSNSPPSAERTRASINWLRRRVRLSEGFSYFVTPITAPVASGWSGCWMGFAPNGKRRLVTVPAIRWDSRPAACG